MKKSQLFSVDFLLAVAVLTLALGIWLNSYSQMQKNAPGNIVNASAFALTENYYSKLSSGTPPLQLGCSESGSVVSCDSCNSEEKFFMQRLYSQGGSAKLLRVGVCS